MRSFLIAALAATLPVTLANPIAAACGPVRVIVARASTEPQGYGTLGSLVKLIKAKIPKATSTSIVYPATLENYANSSSSGVAALATELKSSAAACKDTKFVLLGYSQGAHVIGDALCGAGDDIGGLAIKGPPVVGEAITSRIAASVLMGDPRWVPGLPFDVGTATAPGVFERESDQRCTGIVADNMRSYCDKDDLFCASGESLEIHMGYSDEYNEDAAKFIFQKLGVA